MHMVVCHRVPKHYTLMFDRAWVVSFIGLRIRPMTLDDAEKEYGNATSDPVCTAAPSERLFPDFGPDRLSVSLKVLHVTPAPTNHSLSLAPVYELKRNFYLFNLGSIQAQVEGQRHSRLSQP